MRSAFKAGRWARFDVPMDGAILLIALVILFVIIATLLLLELRRKERWIATVYRIRRQLEPQKKK